MFEERVETSWRITVGQNGELVVPEPLCRALALTPGQAAVLSIDEHRLVVESPVHISRRLVKRFEALPTDLDLADELIAERREESARTS